MPPGHPEPPQDQRAPTAVEFDAVYSAVPASPGLRKAWRLAVPELPPEIEPFWQPHHPGDHRLPPRARIDWPPLLHAAGFTDVDMAERPEWHALWARVYQVALDLGDPGDDTALADLQDEARHRLPLVGLSRRVVVTAATPA